MAGKAGLAGAPVVSAVDGGEQRGAGGGAGGDRQQVADGGEAPVLQGKPERHAGEQQADRAERNGPERMPGGRGRVGEPTRHRHR